MSVVFVCQEQLEREREDLKKKMQAELEANIKERETVLLTQLTAQRAQVLAEKTQVKHKVLFNRVLEFLC